MINTNNVESNSSIFKSITNNLMLEMPSIDSSLIAHTIPDGTHAAATTHAHHHHNHTSKSPPPNKESNSSSPAAASATAAVDDDDNDNINDENLVRDEHDHDEDHVLCVNSDGGILNGSVGSLNKYLVPHNQSTNTQPSKVGSNNKNRKQSSSSSSSSSSSASTSTNNSGAGIGDAASSSSSSSEPQEYIDFDEIADQPDSILLSFKCPLSDEREVEWRTLLVNGVLYVDIPTSVLPEGSRDSFVSLLEFAEDKLDCSKVFVCFKRARPDRNALMRVFMFLGFTVVPPDYKLCPQNDDIMCMVYNIQ